MEPLNKEKRIKREIANSNERRRMQSINAGFQKLKRLLPVNDGEKISKANILQHAADFITNIERDRINLADQNTLLRRILLDLKGGKIDLEAALTPVQSPTPNSMLSVPLKLTMADLADSQDSSTPASTPSRTPTMPNLEASPAMLLSMKTSTATTTTAPTKAITTSNIVNSNNLNQSTTTTRVPKVTRTPKNPRKTTRINNSSRSSSQGQQQQQSGGRSGRGLGRSGGGSGGNRHSMISNQNADISSATSMSNSLVESADLSAFKNVNVLNVNTSAAMSASMTNDNTQNIGCVAEINSDKNTSPRNGLPTAPGGGAAAAGKAAIALPLEVPYTLEVMIGKSSEHSHHQQAAAAAALVPPPHLHHQRPSDDFEAELMTTGPRKLLKPLCGGAGGGILTGLDAQDGGASKGQNLDTICKAIMEIEGDRVFKKEKLE